MSNEEIVSLMRSLSQMTEPFKNFQIFLFPDLGSFLITYQPGGSTISVDTRGGNQRAYTSVAE